MRIAKVFTASAASVVLLVICACTDQVGVAQGDPGRDTAAQKTLLDSNNATVATANGAAPMSASSATPLPRSTLQPSLPAVDAAGRQIRD
jgi:hypothetical protein